jgi:hypothetical protein
MAKVRNEGIEDVRYTLMSSSSRYKFVGDRALFPQGERQQ